MSTLAKTFSTPEDYLAIERKAEQKSEYYDGQMFAMSGVSRQHDRIEGQLYLLVGNHLRGRDCEWFTSAMRLLTPTGLFTYPDMSVVCGEAQFTDSSVDTLTNPVLLVEVLSPITEAYDRGRKAAWYRAIPSLREYLLIAQDCPEVDLFRRGQDGVWTVLDAAGLDASIELVSIGCTLRLRELYGRVFPATESA